jgi:hypothetical protein
MFAALPRNNVGFDEKSTRRARRLDSERRFHMFRHPSVIAESNHHPLGWQSIVI